MSEATPAGLPPHPVRPLAWFEQAELDYQEFAAGGVRTFAIIEGRTDGFPVVLLHGLPGASFVWKPVIDGMPRDRRLIAPDLPGWGRSRSAFSTRPFPWTPANCGKWLADVLAAQGVSEFDLIGHGVGAAIGLEFMRHHPGRVRRLGVITPSPWTPARHRLGARIATIFGGRSWSTDALNRHLTESMSPASAATWRPCFQELLLGSGPAPGPRDIRKGRAEFDAAAAEHRHAWAAFTGRKLVILGDRNPAMSSTALAELKIEAELHCVKAGDYPMFDTADEVRALLQKFLSE